MSENQTQYNGLVVHRSWLMARGSWLLWYTVGVGYGKTKTTTSLK